MVVALSVVKYLSNSFHSVKVSLLLFFLQTWCLLIFFSASFLSSFNFYFLKSSNPLCFFPTLRISSPELSLRLPYHCSLDPLLCFSPSCLHPSLHPPPSQHRSFILL